MLFFFFLSYLYLNRVDRNFHCVFQSSQLWRQQEPSTPQPHYQHLSPHMPHATCQTTGMQGSNVDAHSSFPHPASHYHNLPLVKTWQRAVTEKQASFTKHCIVRGKQEKIARLFPLVWWVLSCVALSIHSMYLNSLSLKIKIHSLWQRSMASVCQIKHQILT